MSIMDRINTYRLHRAVKKGNYHAVASLLDKGVNPDLPSQKIGKTLLHRLADVRVNEAGQLNRQAVNQLINQAVDYGANLDIFDRSGNTPLHRAILKHTPTVRLTPQGTEIDESANDGAPCVEALPVISDSKFDDLTAARILLGRGANASLRNGEGKTPLQLLESVGPTNGFRQLLKESLLQAQART